MASPVSIQVDMFDLYSWLNFGIAANNYSNIIGNSLSFLLLRKNLDLALQIPVKYKFNLSDFQRKLTCALDIDLASERTDFSGVNMLEKKGLSKFSFYARYFYHQSGRLRNKIKSKLGMNVTTHLQEAWDYKPLYKKLLNSDLSRFLDYNNLSTKNIIDSEKWNDHIVSFKNNSDLKIKNYEYMLKFISIEVFIDFCKKIHKDFSWEKK